ncbi:Fructosamine kinase-domain-containing protein [Podospora conica]|nr:Fructosamine kinase-domain-containing protein [Schizothecium conicum]
MSTSDSSALAEYLPENNIGETQPMTERTPVDNIPLPTLGGSVEVDENVVKALPIPGSVLVDAKQFGKSNWGNTAKLVIRLPGGTLQDYFLKVVPKMGLIGKQMCQGEFESLKAIDAVSPGFVPKPYAWGEIKCEEGSYFLLVEFRHIGRQPAKPYELATRLADMHLRSVSPTGKFGFHVATCHSKIIQPVDVWDDSWCVVFGRHLGHIIDLASPVLQWPEFDLVSRLVLEKVVPRLLLPLQSEGRVLKPSLIHGDCWDGNTAMDMKTGEAFIFDACSFYGHNEYETGNWRAPRHKLSEKAYIENYKSRYEASDPAEDWDARNLLYSLPYNIGNAIYVAESSQKQVVYEDMTTLCNMFCPNDLRQAMRELGDRMGSEGR